MKSSRRPLSRSEKSLFALCAFALVPLGAVVFVSSGRDAQPNWNIAPLPARPKPNGYDFYVAATRATVRFTPEIDPASDPKVYVPGSAYALKNYSLARRSAWLKANTKTFALFNQGLKTPSMAPDYATKPMADWGILRQLARDVNARTHTFQMAKQPMRATMSALDGMQMGQDSTRGGGLMARLVGIAMMSITRDPLEDWNVTINALNSTEAKRAARRLETILAREPNAAQTLTVDKRDTLVELKRVFGIPGWRGSLSLKSPEETYAQALQRQTVSKQTIHANTTRALDAGIAISRLPYSKARKTAFPTDLDVFTQEFTGSQIRFFGNEARTRTSNNMLLLRLALHAYIADNKTAPPTLSALVPAYLKAIPTDVYNDDKPMFYQPKGATYKLWSVGPDGINNGGVPFKPKYSNKTTRPVSNTLDNTGDFVAGLCR